MRQVVLDTETTGLEVRARTPHHRDRLRRAGATAAPPAGTFTTTSTPNATSTPARAAVHGMTLARRSRTSRASPQIAEEFLQFVDGAELIIHNAPFDVGVPRQRAGAPVAATAPSAADLRCLCRVLDTLALAREMHPGQRNSLDALCKRYCDRQLAPRAARRAARRAHPGRRLPGDDRRAELAGAGRGTGGAPHCGDGDAAGRHGRARWCCGRSVERRRARGARATAGAVHRQGERREAALWRRQ